MQSVGDHSEVVGTAPRRRFLPKLVPPRRRADTNAAVLAELRARLVAFLDQHREITPQQWKELTATSRKYSIPLAEYFDGEKLTLRVGDVRRRR